MKCPKCKGTGRVEDRRSHAQIMKQIATQVRVLKNLRDLSGDQGKFLEPELDKFLASDWARDLLKGDKS